MEVTDSAQGTYCELPTWYAYEDSQKSNPAEEAVPANVLKVRNLSDIRRNEIIKEYYVKHWQDCPLNVYIEIKPTFVYHVNTFGLPTLLITIATKKDVKSNY